MANLTNDKDISKALAIIKNVIVDDEVHYYVTKHLAERKNDNVAICSDQHKSVITFFAEEGKRFKCVPLGLSIGLNETVCNGENATKVSFIVEA